MNASVISALAALVGAAIGGMTSVLASWLTQRTQVRAVAGDVAPRVRQTPDLTPGSAP